MASNAFGCDGVEWWSSKWCEGDECRGYNIFESKLVRLNRLACVVDDKDDLLDIPNPVCWCENCDTFVMPVETKQSLYNELWDARDDNCSDDNIFIGMTDLEIQINAFAKLLIEKEKHVRPKFQSPTIRLGLLNFGPKCFNADHSRQLSPLTPLNLPCLQA